MRLGIDLGGTKIAAVVLDASGHEVWAGRAATPRDDYRATVDAIVALVAAGEAAVETACTVGVGTPGSEAAASGLIRNANSTWLNGRALRSDLDGALGRSIRIANDANCLALSEASDGAAVGQRVVFGVILGTGVGGGLVVDGRPREGANGIAGEWGHNPLPWPDDLERPGPPCYCGRSGCIETFLSGPGLSADHARRTGTLMRSEDVVSLAGAGDAGARSTMAAWYDRLARALATVINVLDPNVVVVGGGLSNVERLSEDVQSRWKPWIFSDAVNTRLVRASHGDTSGVRGAAALWP